jgi:hypothetical protein
MTTNPAAENHPAVPALLLVDPVLRSLRSVVCSATTTRWSRIG